MWLLIMAVIAIVFTAGGVAKCYGYEKRGNTNFIVTSGISDWAFKFKTGCKFEYVVINVN